MTKWAVEASANGKDKWKVLHSAPGNEKPTFTQKQKDILKSEMSMKMEVPKEPDPVQKVGIVLDQVEKSKRKVWKIESPPNEFYKYFRIVAIGQDSNELSSSMEMDNDSNHAGTLLKTKRALDRVGFELFGEIHEE